MRKRFLGPLTLAVVAAAAGPAAAAPGTGLVKVPAEATQTILGPSSDSQLGTTLSAGGDIDDDGRADLVSALPNPFSVDGSGVAVTRGGPTGVLALQGTAVPPAAGYAIKGAALDRGSANVGDVNGDGRPDVAVHELFTGSVAVIYGRAGQRLTYQVTETIPPEAGFRVTDVATASVTGTDLNGDGLSDLVMGIQGNPTGSPCEQSGGFPGCEFFEQTILGELVVVFGKPDRQTVAAQQLQPADGFRVKLDSTGPLVVSPAGDTNGDGFNDLLVGVPEKARAYVLLGSAAPTSTELAGDDIPQGRGFVIRVPAAQAGSRLGAAVADVGDVNGDKLADVAVGAPKLGPGIAWVVFGRPLGSTVDLTADNFQLGQVLVGPKGSGFGTAIDGAGDVNGDGRPDLLVGAPGTSAAYVLRSLQGAGRTNVPVSEALSPALGFAIRGDATTPGLGSSVAGLGDGRVAVGAPLGGGARSGAVFVVSARSASPRTTALLSFNSGVGRTTLTAGQSLPLKVSTSRPASIAAWMLKADGKRSCPLNTLGTARTCRPTYGVVSSTSRLLTKTTSGARSVRFATTVGGKALGPGSYILEMRAVAKGSGASLLRTVKFTIKK